MLQLGNLIYGILVVFVILILLSCCCRCCQGRKKVVKEVHREVRYVEHPAEPPRVIEKERIIERVLVICPFCGNKNEQGAPKCAHCGAQL